MQLDTKALTLEIAGTINGALTPLLERVSVLETRVEPLGDVRDRLIAVETKCCDFPVGPDQAAEQRLVSALERLSTLEYALRRVGDYETMIADLKVRLSVAEAVAGKYEELATLARQLIDRVSTAEAKSDAFAQRCVELETSARDAARTLDKLSGELETKQAHAASAADVTAQRDRLTVLETKLAAIDARAAEPNPLTAAVERNDRAVVDLAKDLGAMRERVAVVEVRQPVPGPAGTPGKDGLNGKDGREGSDGIGWGDISVVQGEDLRTFSFQGERDGRVKVFGTFVVPSELYRGVWDEGQGYVKGDCVTWGGSEWHCNEPTVLKPGEGTKAWTLKVKRGRDGRDGKAAAAPLPVVSVGRS